MTDFKLWLEFEEVDPGNWDIENEFCNGINVWTYRFIETARKEMEANGKNLDGMYLQPPDLLVKELTRECIEKTIQDLLKTDDLEKMLNPSIYSGRRLKE